MPPKSRGRGRPRGSRRGKGRTRKAPEPSSEEAESNDESSDSTSNMSDKEGKARPTRRAPAMEPRFPRPTGAAAGTPIVRVSPRRPRKDAVPDVLMEMVQEATEKSPERPLKKRRIRSRGTSTAASLQSHQPRDDESVQFEDVSTPKLEQTIFKESDDESDENDLTWEDVEVDQAESTLEALPASGPSTSTLQDLDLNLSASAKVPQSIKTPTIRRKPITKDEKKSRIFVHKLHILWLLGHVNTRNHWCNDSQVHSNLAPLLTGSMMKFFKPEKGSDAEKMKSADRIKAGLNFANNMWRNKFQITETGTRRALWAAQEEDLNHFGLPDKVDSVLDIDDFRAAAKKLKGSRDVGAQLYCALLRCAGLDVRLVCSLQPLSWKRLPDEPSMPVMPASKTREKTPEQGKEPSIDVRSLSSPIGVNASSNNGTTPLTAARRRLGNPDASYGNPTATQPSSKNPVEIKNKPIQESSYPIYWVEVLSDGPPPQWIPVDPLVLKNNDRIDHRKKFEPPASDKENNMIYVIAFEDDGRAREVTRRYTKAYNSKTLKLRVESTEGGQIWWKKVMGYFDRGFLSGMDDVENLELANFTSQEPMPKNIMDFKDHPIYALERHIKRNEVLVTKKEIGKIAVPVKNEGMRGAKTKKLESVYSRNDVKIAKSADGWYRIGREVKMGEQPVKTVPATRRADDDVDMDAGNGEVQDRAGVGLYTEDQTQVYEAPPVINGRVPTNSYGNLDIYVPSMVPRGGVHIPDPEAKLAARIVGVHSADAVTGFEFRGRHGTAVVRGIVVAVEFQEAIEAVIQGLRDAQQNAEDERRSLVAVRMWKKFLVGLRIKARVAGYEVEGERDELQEANREVEDSVMDDSGMDSEEYVDDGAGGFFPE